MFLSFLPLSIVFPSIDPIIFSIGPVSIRWYALSYVAGILIGWWYLGILRKKSPDAISQKAYDDIIVWIILGVLLGGRLGYVLFYNLGHYLSNPSQIIAIWNGGMSFHGGLIGVILAIYLLCRFYRLKFWPVVDLLACVGPIGLFLGRIANFINAELYGRVSDVPWAVVFPNEPFARHPSQLYEAGLEGVILFLIMTFFAFRSDLIKKPGALSGMFLVGYSAFRSFIEMFREPDSQLGFLFSHTTMGQLLSLPMFVLGLYLLFRPVQRKS